MVTLLVYGHVACLSGPRASASSIRPSVPGAGSAAAPPRPSRDQAGTKTNQKPGARKPGARKPGAQKPRVSGPRVLFPPPKERVLLSIPVGWVRPSRTAYAGTDMYLWCKQLPLPSSRARISTSRRDRSILPPGRGFSAVPEIGPLYHSCCAHPAAPALHTWNLVTLQLCHFPILPPVFPDFLFRLRGLGIVHLDEVVPSQYQCSPPHGVTDDNIGVLQPGTPHAAFIAHKT